MVRSHRKTIPWSGLLLLLLALSLACGPAGSGAQTKNKDSAVLVILCEVPDAEVWINSRYSRTTAEFKRGIRVKAGSYRVEVRHRDFHSRYYDLTFRAKERRTLEVDLARRFQ
jgi:hypothetical protein